MELQHLKDLVTIDAAARKIGMGRRRLRELVITHRIGIPWGGSAKRPILRVKLSGVEQMLLMRRYDPSPTEQPGRRAGNPNLHRHVRC